MSGRRSLSAGKPRLLGNHHGQVGKWYGECWAALGELAPLTGLLRLEAGRVCVCWVQFRVATEALEDARRKQRTGTGRRPGGRNLERLARRQGLSDGTFSQALAQFRDLVDRTQRRPAATPADVMRRLRAGAGAPS